MSKKPMKLKYKKAPCAPKRFKSAFIFFSEFKHKEIRQQVGGKVRAADAAKKVSQAWKSLSQEDRSVWNEHARLDRERFEREKAVYKGPWKIPDTKDSSTPKKPMSAFLAFSNERRRAIGDANPHLTNPDVSALLSQMWKTAPAELKKVYRDREAEERKQFKKAMAKWESQRCEKLYQESLEESSKRRSKNTSTFKLPPFPLSSQLMDYVPNDHQSSELISTMDVSQLTVSSGESTVSSGTSSFGDTTGFLSSLGQVCEPETPYVSSSLYNDSCAGLLQDARAVDPLSTDCADPIYSSSLEDLELLTNDLESFLEESRLDSTRQMHGLDFEMNK